MKEKHGTPTPTLLVVDDEPAILRMLVEALETPSCKVLTATRGDEAVELFRSHRDQIKLVLLDLQMHPWNGMEVLQDLRSIDPCVRVALMSGSPSELQVQGVDSIFPKPFPSMKTLSIALNRLLSGD